MFLAARAGCLNHLAELTAAECAVVRRRGRRQALADLVTARDLVGRTATSAVEAPVYVGPALDQAVLATVPAGQPFVVINEVNQDIVWLMVQAPTRSGVGFTPFLPEAMSAAPVVAAGVAPTRAAAAAPPTAAAPGFGTLVWRTLTGAGQGLFQCRPDSWFCAGSGAQAYGPTGPGAGAPPASAAPTWFYLAAGAAVGLLALKVLGAR